ncbi:MAG TPA: YcxB family protein [Clostridiales bacterium]|nr:YcxB family protein [Clostridiales bacterium]
MTSQKLSKAKVLINPTKEEYVKSVLLVERQIGYLRPLPIAVIASAILPFLGLSSFNWFRVSYSSIFLPLILCFSCPVLLIYFFYLQPSLLKERAAGYYKTYSVIMKDSVMEFFDDNMVTKTQYLTLNDSYALMSLCIETPELFVLAKDSERIIVIPKRCIPMETREELTAFLRQAFAPRRKVMKSWIF